MSRNREQELERENAELRLKIARARETMGRLEDALVNTPTRIRDFYDLTKRAMSQLVEGNKAATPGSIRALFSSQDLDDPDQQAREQVERELFEAGIIEDPEDGGLLG
jgi:hypothetical protein